MVGLGVKPLLVNTSLLTILIGFQLLHLELILPLTACFTHIGQIMFCSRKVSVCLFISPVWNYAFIFQLLDNFSLFIKKVIELNKGELI